MEIDGEIGLFVGVWERLKTLEVEGLVRRIARKFECRVILKSLRESGLLGAKRCHLKKQSTTTMSPKCP